MARLRVRKANVDKRIRGQFQAVHPKAKGDPDSVYEVALPVKKIGSDPEITRLGNFLSERQCKFKTSVAEC